MAIADALRWMLDSAAFALAFREALFLNNCCAWVRENDEKPRSQKILAI
jgi:hypothetical protein